MMKYRVYTCNLSTFTYHVHMVCFRCFGPPLPSHKGRTFHSTHYVYKHTFSLKSFPAQINRSKTHIYEFSLVSLKLCAVIKMNLPMNLYTVSVLTFAQVINEN